MITLLFLSLMAYTAWWVHPVAFSLSGIEVKTFGLVMGISFMAVTSLLQSELTRAGLKVEAGEIATWAIIGGLLGSKLHFIYGSNFQDFSVSSLTAGMSFQGGGFLGAIAVMIFLKFRGERILPYADHCLSLFPFGYALGKIGCFLAGDGCYGPKTTLPWGMRFPNGLVPTYTPVHPTPLYEFALGIFFWFFLLSRRQQALKRPGDQSSAALIGMGINRLLAEPFRHHTNDNVFWIGLNQFQIFSLLLIIGGFAWRYFWVQKALREKVKKKDL